MKIFSHVLYCTLLGGVVPLFLAVLPMVVVVFRQGGHNHGSSPPIRGCCMANFLSSACSSASGACFQRIRLLVVVLASLTSLLCR